MPRRAPINPEGYYHVSTRGSFGQPLFQSPSEHELYLELFRRYASKLGWKTLAWALLWNHQHFLIKLSDDGLSEGMRAINHGFSRRINAIHGRTGTGHLVRHSFFAKEIADDDYLRNAIRYIDLNAVAAGRCRHPGEWPWSSCRASLGREKPREFHDVRATLAAFGARPGRARERYAHFLLEPFPGNGYDIAPDLQRVIRSAA